MKRRTELKLIRYAKKATKAIAVVDGIGWMILVTLLDSEPPIGDIVMKYFILTMAILILCLVQMELLDRIKNSLNAGTSKGTNKITVTGGLYEVFKIFIGFIFTVACCGNRWGNFLQ